MITENEWWECKYNQPIIDCIDNVDPIYIRSCAMEALRMLPRSLYTENIPIMNDPYALRFHCEWIIDIASTNESQLQRLKFQTIVMALYHKKHQELYTSERKGFSLYAPEAFDKEINYLIYTLINVNETMFKLYNFNEDSLSQRVFHEKLEMNNLNLMKLTIPYPELDFKKFTNLVKTIKIDHIDPAGSLLSSGKCEEFRYHLSCFRKTQFDLGFIPENNWIREMKL